MNINCFSGKLERKEYPCDKNLFCRKKITLEFGKCKKEHCMEISQDIVQMPLAEKGVLLCLLNRTEFARKLCNSFV